MICIVRYVTPSSAAEQQTRATVAQGLPTRYVEVLGPPTFAHFTYEQGQKDERGKLWKPTL